MQTCYRLEINVFFGNTMKGTSKSYEGFHIRLQYLCLVLYVVCFHAFPTHMLLFYRHFYQIFIHFFLCTKQYSVIKKNLKIYWRTHLKFKLCLLFLHFIHICQELATTISASKHMKSYSHKHWYTQTHICTFISIYIWKKNVAILSFMKNQKHYTKFESIWNGIK